MVSQQITVTSNGQTATVTDGNGAPVNCDVIYVSLDKAAAPILYLGFTNFSAVFTTPAPSANATAPTATPIPTTPAT